MTQIDDKHAALLGSGLNLGNPVGPEVPLYDGGFVRPYEFGRIYFHPRIGQAFELHGLILGTYLNRGAEYSGLGYPISDESEDPNVFLGRMNRFELGYLRYDPATGMKTELPDFELPPTVTVKVVDGTLVPLGPGDSMDLTTFATSIVGPGFEGVVASIAALLPDFTLRRILDNHSADEIQVMIDEAQAQDPEYTPPNFNNFLCIECPTGFDTDSLTAVVNQLAGVVEYAYTTPPAFDPAVVGTGNPKFAAQRYLTAAPDGIGVQAAWATGADGAGAHFIDVEQGWLLNHEELKHKQIQLIHGINRWSSRGHGTAVLGVVIAKDDAVGVCGIAPKASTRVVSWFSKLFTLGVDTRERYVFDVRNAIFAASSELWFGEVMLIEVESPFDATNFNSVPETDPLARECIRLATKRGVTVVEVAGNDGVNLDAYTDSGHHVLDRNSPDFKESGAIVVGAAHSARPHERWVHRRNGVVTASSGFGNRVDCYAWGENVVTSGDRSENPATNSYMNDFNGTSSAGSIIAGVCILTQHLCELLGAGKVTAKRLREILTAPQNSTPAPAGAAIGVMPDLAKIVANEFPKFNSAVAKFKNTFGTHTEMFTYGQFYVTNRTIDDMLTVIEAHLRNNIRFTADPDLLNNTLMWFRENLKVDVRQISVAAITAMLDLIEQDGDMAVVRGMFTFPTGNDAAEARREFDQIWSGDTIPSAPFVSGSSPSVGKALAARQLEQDQSFQVTRSMARKLTKLRGTAPLPSTAVLSTSQLAGAGIMQTVPPSPGAHDSGQQVIRHSDPGALPAIYEKMRKTIDSGGLVHCGVLSGATGSFPQPAHDVLVFAYDTVGGKDKFLFWDPDTNRSNIASTSMAPGLPGWGPGFGVLVATAARLSTATDDDDLKAIDRNDTSPFFGDHTADTRRHCYQVYDVQSLPMPKRVTIHTKVLAPPKHTSLDTMLHNAVTLYGSYGVEILEASREDLTQVSDAEFDRFRTLYCGFDDEPTAEVTDLHEMSRSERRGFGVTPGESDIVVTIVNDLVPAALGSPKSPIERPGVVVSAAATDWTLAHELGHVLGLADISDPTHLMNTSTTAITVDPPQLAAAEVTTIGESPLVEDG